MERIDTATYRPMADTKYMTTQKKEEHPQDVVYTLDKNYPFIYPEVLMGTYTLVYGKNSGVDAAIITSMPCNASQLLAREVRKEGDRRVVIVIYDSASDHPPQIIPLTNGGQREQLLTLLEANPHQKAVDLIDIFMNK